MIELLTSTGYSIVEASWHSAAFFTKFYLITVLIRSIDSIEINAIDFESVEQLLLEESKMFLGFLLAIGISTLMIGVELRPTFPVISEGIALAYLVFLFWKF